jgi:hypothetical protein
MANNFTLTLDTIGPASPTLQIDANAAFSTDFLVDLTIGTADGNTTGYTMKIWGDLDLAQAKTDGLVGGAATATNESDALWITFTTSRQVRVTAGDGTKTLYLKIRDDVYNVSAQASDSITVDSTAPVVTITGPDVSKISKQTGKRTSTFSFTVNDVFEEFKVKVVSSTGAAHTTGTQIGTANGSTNMSGTAGGYAASTPITCSIDGADLEAASAGDGSKIIKVFVRDAAGNWSV